VVSCRSSCILSVRTLLYARLWKIIGVVWNLRAVPIPLLAKKLHPSEIAQIELPIDWAMCEVLWYGMVLVAHPHDYPQTIHIFCGQQDWGRRCPATLSPFPSRRCMLMAVKHLCGSSVSASTPTFAPWSEQMSAHDLKTRHVGYSCACVIHNFSSNQRIERPGQSAQTQTPNLSLSPSCNKPRKDGMMPPFYCLFL
jgi:hypothetical protein